MQGRKPRTVSPIVPAPQNFKLQTPTQTLNRRSTRNPNMGPPRAKELMRRMQERQELLKDTQLEVHKPIFKVLEISLRNTVRVAVVAAARVGLPYGFCNRGF